MFQLAATRAKINTTGSWQGSRICKIWFKSYVAV